MIPWPIDGKAVGMEKNRITLWPIAPLILVMAAAIGYGCWRMSGQNMRPGPTVALIQGDIEMNFGGDNASPDDVVTEYIDQSKQALAKRANLSLVVWPETMYRYGLFSFQKELKPPKEWTDQSSETPEQVEQRSRNYLSELQNRFKQIVHEQFNLEAPPPLLFGLEAVYGENEKDNSYTEHHYNSAQFIDPNGQPLNRYDKMHPVMFGEYIPLAEYIPFLYKITPLTGGLTVGTAAVCQELNGIRYAPDVCYETVIPHLIRRQVLELRQQSKEPDVLVNVTNDAWFRNSSELDMHLACDVFRAIEMRKPLVIAANMGLTASIDGDGRVVDQIPRGKKAFLIADVRLDSRHSFYLDHGDWFSALCLLGCIGLAAVGIWVGFGRQNHKSFDRHSSLPRAAK
jgi:apolipoprotein N-acyltransferase